MLVSSAIDSSGQLVGVAEGEWWRLITAAFLLRAAAPRDEHARPLVHRPTARKVLRPRSLRPRLPRVGPRRLRRRAALVAELADGWRVGAIWGIMGAALILEARRIYVFGGQAMGLVVLNLALTFLIPGISIGGHIGGLVGEGYAPSRSRASGGSRRLPPPPSSPSASSASPSRWPRWLRSLAKQALCRRPVPPSPPSRRSRQR